MMYTVLLLYPRDYEQGQDRETYLAHIRERSQSTAIETARAEAAQANDDPEAADRFEVVAVFPGYHEDIKP